MAAPARATRSQSGRLAENKIECPLKCGNEFCLVVRKPDGTVVQPRPVPHPHYEKHLQFCTEFKILKKSSSSMEKASKHAWDEFYRVLHGLEKKEQLEVTAAEVPLSGTESPTHAPADDQDSSASENSNVSTLGDHLGEIGYEDDPLPLPEPDHFTVVDLGVFAKAIGSSSSKESVANTSSVATNNPPDANISTAAVVDEIEKFICEREKQPGECAHLREAATFGLVSERVTRLAEKDHFIGHRLRGVNDDLFDRKKSETHHMKSMIRLIDYCDHTNGNSRTFLDGLLKIVGEEILNSGFDPSSALARQTISAHVIKNYSPGPPPRVGVFRCSGVSNPYLITDKDELAVRRRDIMNCIVFDVKSGILDLLGDRGIFGDLNNLVVNKEDPFLPYIPRDGGDEVLDGSWSRNTRERMKKYDKDPFNPYLEYMLDMILYYDKTGTTGNQRYPLEPFVFTLSIIRRKLRNNSRSWRPFGFMPDLEAKSSADQVYSRGKNPGITQQTYHRFLSFILEGIKKVQDDGIVTWLRLGNQVKKVVLRINVAFIIQDGKSADMTTLRRGNNFSDDVRISRSCTCLRANADSIPAKCEYFELDDIKDQIIADKKAAQVAEMDVIGSDVHDPQERERQAEDLISKAKIALIRKGFYPVENAFLGIHFGLDPRHVLGATPVDIMHAFQSGILMYETKMIIDKLGPKARMELDHLVEELFGCYKTSVSASFPRFSFTKGFCKVSNITSDEWAGKLFVLYMVSLTERGQNIMKKRFKVETTDGEHKLPFQNLEAAEQAAKFSETADNEIFLPMREKNARKKEAAEKEKKEKKK